MKILIITAFFPPYNAIGSIRVGKLAKFLVENGHDVRVITANHTDLKQNLKLEIKKKFIYKTYWFDFLNLVKMSNPSNSKNKIQNSNFFSYTKLINFIKSILFWPDRHAFWYFSGVKTGSNLINSWKPDIIYGSAWPITSLLICKKLSSNHIIPWVAELRDLWVDNPYYYTPIWRKKIDLYFENKILSTAKSLITVSEPLKEILSNKFDVSSYVIQNGFDLSDYPKKLRGYASDKFNITYTGNLYYKKRDPTTFLKAVSKIRKIYPNIRVNFYGRNLHGLKNIINKLNLNKIVIVNKEVSYRKSLQIQKASDLLLLILWNNDAEKGIFSGKIFEYIGSRRPVLLIGQKKGVAASLINEKKIGYVCNDEDTIVSKLEELILLKKKNKKINDVKLSSIKGFSREEEFQKLLPILYKSLKKEIIIVTKKLDIGGTEKHLLSVLPKLKNEFDIKIFVLDEGGKLEKYFNENKIPLLHSSKANSKLFKKIKNFIYLYRLMKRKKHSIFHFYLPEPYIVGGLVGTFLKHKNMLMSRRSLNFYQSKRKFLKKVEIFLHKKMRFIIANSKSVIQNLKDEKVPSENVKIIYNGIVQLKKNKSIKKNYFNYKLRKNSFKIVVVSNLIKYKGHLDLLEAMSLIKKDLFKEWQLIFVGRDDGIKHKIVSKAQNLGLYQNLVIFDQIYDVNKIWSVADLSVLPSHEEGFSNSLIEGMGHGIPTIATNVGGNVDAIVNYKNGLLVDKKSPLQLGKAILKIINEDSFRKEIGDNAFIDINQKFTLNKTISKYRELYNYLLIR